MTSFCPNYRCFDRLQPDTAQTCGSCHTPLIIDGKYRLTKLIRTSPEKAADSHPAFYWTELFQLQSNDAIPDSADARSVPQDVCSAHSGNRLLKILVIKPEYLQDPSSAVELRQVQARFVQEFQLLQRQLPGVCRGYELLEVPLADGLVAMQGIVMEYVDGINLDEYVRRYGAIDSAHAWRWLEQLIETIGILHQHQIQHRDIKPSNIIITGRGIGEKPVVIDLGIALDLTSHHPTAVLGTPPFADPAYLHEPKSYQNNFDFYGLGMTFVYLLTGGATKQNWSTEVVYPDLDPKLRNVIQRMIATDDYQQRFANADEIHQFIHPPAAVMASRIPKWLKILGLMILALITTRLVIWIVSIQPVAVVLKKEYVHDICSLMVSGSTASVKCGDNISSEFSSVFPDIPDAFLALSSPKKDDRQTAVQKYENALNAYKQRKVEKEAIGEITIYLNNAKVQANHQDLEQIYTLLVAVPKYDKPRGVKSNILSGAAQVQKYFNDHHQNIKLYIAILQEPDSDHSDNRIIKSLLDQVIARSNNSPTASGINSKIVGVLGHYSSQTTFDLLELYAKNQILTISSSSTRTSILKDQKMNPADLQYFARVISNGQSQAYEIVNFLHQLANNDKNCDVLDIHILYQQDDVYSNSLSMEINRLFDLPNDTADSKDLSSNAIGNVRITQIPYKQRSDYKSSVDLIKEMQPKLLQSLQKNSKSSAVSSECRATQSVVFLPGAHTRSDPSEFIQSIVNHIPVGVNLVGNITVGDRLSYPDLQRDIVNKDIYNRTYIVAPYNILDFLPTIFAPKQARIDDLGFIKDAIEHNAISPNTSDILDVNWRQIAAADAARVFTKAIEQYHHNKGNYNSQKTTQAIQSIIKSSQFEADGIFSKIKFDGYERERIKSATILKYIPKVGQVNTNGQPVMVAVPIGYRDPRIPRTAKETAEYSPLSIADLGESKSKVD